MAERREKVMDLTEAVSKFVNDGDSFIPANFMLGMAYATMHEIIRQRKKNLTAISCSSVDEMDLMVQGGCISKIITSYYHRAGGKVFNRALDRAIRKKTIEYEDYCNFTMVNMLKAGAMGFTFLPTLKSIMYSDMYNIRTIQGENKFKVIECPFTGKETVLVPALSPDVALLHVQRCDKYGNAQLWGSLGTTRISALASKKIIVTCEEIVDHEKIKRSPFFTIVPEFRTSAVCVVPYGAHPASLAGYYNADVNFQSLYYGSAHSKKACEFFLNEWVLDKKDRKEYIDHYIERFGQKPFDVLKVNEYMTDSVNFGYNQKIWQDDFIHKIAMTREEYLEKIDEIGEYEL
ncbi:MAG: CoA transferase subunit A [archaeon]|nr:CoA transferase subunit A [archaeon]